MSELIEGIDQEALYLDIPCSVNDKEDFIRVTIREGHNNLKFKIDGKTYHVSRDHFIRLGNLAKPLTYVEETGAWGTRTKRYE